MGLFDRIGRVVRANLNDLVNKAEDPEKILEQAVIEMQEDLIQLRQAVAQTIAQQKRSQQQYNQAQSQANQWQSRAQLALQKGDENLAREALQRKKGYVETANTLEISLRQQTEQVETLKRNLVSLESKISEAKTKKNMLKARAQAAKANEQLNNLLGGINTSSATSAFERMEEKVMIQEAKSQATAELTGSDLEEQFIKLEAGSDVDDELAAMKAQLAGAPANQPQLSPSEPTDSSASNPEIDSELEELRRELNK
ncbi:MAG: PspA/IM30 family protein [Limnospira sp. PMC 737.11]|uniref:PspA/IM30 family protein n=1 Tax=Limnospira fusiformis PMC 851.14 TaxID=2219512 RepID=A0ABU9EFT6_LIMFS|nr:PspA/IM30 family protein [Limnospira sp. PMC 737.11]MDT9274837.1 PspA/IM30 family protein [Limnospira sp. PMC 737.11]MDT9274838.1 PspA/IM30 family protein [Limnospira sp. PMC 737.11]